MLYIGTWIVARHGAPQGSVAYPRPGCCSSARRSVCSLLDGDNDGDDENDGDGTGWLPSLALIQDRSRDALHRAAVRRCVPSPAADGIKSICIRARRPSFDLRRLGVWSARLLVGLPVAHLVCLPASSLLPCVCCPAHSSHGSHQRLRPPTPSPAPGAVLAVGRKLLILSHPTSRPTTLGLASSHPPPNFTRQSAAGHVQASTPSTLDAPLPQARIRAPSHRLFTLKPGATCTVFLMPIISRLMLLPVNPNLPCPPADWLRSGFPVLTEMTVLHPTRLVHMHPFILEPISLK